MTQIVVNYKDKKLSVQSSSDLNSIQWLKGEIWKLTKIPVIQQELSFMNEDKKQVLSDNNMPLKLSNVPEYKFNLKNLGFQIRWNHVFYIEYLGPILILPLFYLIGKRDQYTQTQTLALIMGILHYLKRQYETAYVHVFSRQSMPFKRVLINSGHYWILFGLMNAIELYLFPSGHTYSPVVNYSIVGLWALFEFCNYKCHTILGGFRSGKQKSESEGYENKAKVRKIPYGWGFNQVSSANYLWEALGWLTFSILTRNWTAYLFTIFSIYQMLEWAIQKHKRYRKQFGDKYPKGRKAMFPFII